ncbi:hypothetical protein ORI20_14065 [Mycobacterium sp. CVI_P3]|uniref:Uncharacterized protein n=1 Tax=Mycobacterium pinniadriaticum TaxID=2994102 RepID=A0ABT3SE84_9MYCO|nr:hypothetical protein [Mycobacterium pinniadriaticum]MCX2931406.1 hypothetical protein [Mycobacterium pinniadriaticum]MCX2937830.1 hypothetical protein [Mycobacterium pinniadriaticum]
MTLTFPSWWRGGRWDVERLVEDLFTFEENPAAQDLSGLIVWPMTTPLDPTEREAHLKAGNAYLFAHRRGGHVDKTRQPWTDKVIVDLAALTRSRDISNDLMAYVTDVLAEFDDGGLVHRKNPHRSGVSATFMTVPGEVVGPQLIPEQFRDDRLIPATWELHIDRPQGLSTYREALGLDW